MKKVMEVEAIAAQQEVEVMDCCQKNEEMVIDSGSAENSESKTELTINIAEPGNPEIANHEKTSSDKNLPKPFSLISWACGLGLSILAFRARKLA